MTNQEINEAVENKLGHFVVRETTNERMIPDYAGRIEAAWEIVEFIDKIKGSSFSLNGFDQQTAAWKLDNPNTEFERGKFNASIVIYSPECDKCGKWKHDYYEGFADTAPMAIAKAFLKLEKQ
jgi:hypothetical protein